VVAGSHRQEIAKGDVADAWVSAGSNLLREEVDEPLIEVAQQSIANGDADKSRSETLGDRENVPHLIPRPVVVALEDQVAVSHDQNAHERWQRLKATIRASKQCGIEAFARGGCERYGR
jgi:hypothetical protein